MSKAQLTPGKLALLEAMDIAVWRSRDVPEVGESDANDVDDANAVGIPDAQGAPAAADWPTLRAMVAGCRRCGLHETRQRTVFGVGDTDADWMIIGEAPGAEEDRHGEPFIGEAGQLLDRMLRAAGLERESVFITNILKCRPPGNRNPRVDEAEQCAGYLRRQIELVAPRLILVVGRVAAQSLLQRDDPVGRLRGTIHRLDGDGVPVVVTYHPAYLLRDPAQKRIVWRDLKFALSVAAGEAA